MIASASRSGKRCRYCALNSTISRAAARLNSALMASPDSSCEESIRIVLGRSVQRFSPLGPRSTLLNRARLPGATTVRRSSPSPTSCSQPAIQSNTSFETLVLLQTTMNTGGVSRLPSPRSSAARVQASWYFS
ncbi:MAG: hypothetical protein BWY94_02145 [Actinobacteria bacterium ADurb.BinA094]|nr:MAG: hypothetical protein BWY94_02145 [Actinobacteria bacterium ADurb.BinA094]